MDIEFHYHITGLLAHAAGFTPEEAAVIATASQYVDDNDRIFEIWPEKDPGPEPDYRNYISQTMNILKPGETLMRIYSAFHFAPGDHDAISARRRDGKMHLMNTTPDGPLANRWIDDALKPGQAHALYRIGIASHTYVDTWAHQNFVGWKDSFNGHVLNPIPDIGHAQALHHPDWVGHRWNDDRLVHGDIDNNLRFLAAAAALYQKYAGFCARDPAKSPQPWPQVETSLKNAIGSATYSNDTLQGSEARIARYQALCPLPDYQPNRWFEDAIHTRVRGLPDVPDGPDWLAHLPIPTLFKDHYIWKDAATKTDNHWYHFQEAVKAHQAVAMEDLRPLFEQIGVELH
jgi:hypothetical protein